MLILLFLLAKNCVRSVRYGTSTSDQEIQQQYDQGYATGLIHGANNTDEIKEPQDNPMLIKAYRKGFRAGRDKARTKESSTQQ